MNKKTTIPLFFLAFTIPTFCEEESFWRREHLFGDWGGMRSYLEEHGLSYELVYTGEYFGNVSGGWKRGGEYRGDLSLFLELDTETAGWWNGGTFFVQLQEQHGKGITNDYVGDFQVLSNIDADEFAQVSEFWYRHDFFDGKLWFKLGKQEANADFACADYACDFTNSSGGFHPTIPLTTFPDQDWGAVMGIAPVDWFSMNIGVYQGRPDGGRSIGNTLDRFYGPMVMAEPAFHYSIADHRGHFRVGAWWNGDKVEKLSTTGVFAERYGVYLTWDQEVWRENPADEEDKQGIGVFAQHGWTPEDRSEANHYLGGGMQWIGPIPGRDEDILGLGVFQVLFSEEAGLPKDGETAIELYYLYQMTGWMNLKPDMQYIVNPGGDGKPDALAIGMRWQILF
ncbi:MAG: carbohydrate porin [Candidatus Omnitrophota bacterium]